jgi:hypothetical protein
MLYARSSERDYAMFVGILQENRPTKRMLHEVNKAI